MPLYRNNPACAAIRLLPLIFAIDRVDDCRPVPPNERVGVLFKGARQVAFFLAMLPDSNDALALLCGVLDFPIDPLAVLGLWRDVADEDTRPVDGRREYLRLDVVWVLRVVELSRMNGSISDLHALRLKEMLIYPGQARWRSLMGPRMIEA